MTKDVTKKTKTPKAPKTKALKNTKTLSQEWKEFWERNEASNGILLKETIKKKSLSLFRGILLFGMCFMIIQPILNKIAISFMSERDLYDSTITLIPKHFSISNWKIAADMLSYKTNLFNTLWISVLVSVIEVSMCTLVGYGFSRFQFPLKRSWFFCVILVIVIPPQTISTSLMLHFKYFPLLGNITGKITPYIMLCFTCMGLKNGLYIFMIRQFFLGFPFELEEAAYVDGCGPFKTFFRIMVPGAKPIITSCFLFSFVWQWTDIFYANFFLGNIGLLSKSISGLVERFGQYLSVLYGGATQAPIAYSNAILSTGVLMVVLPLIILYLFCQRLFVESLSSTGVKM